jgi:hypothetical protein
MKMKDAEARFNNMCLPPGVKFAPRGELYTLGGMFTPRVNTTI